MFRNTLVSFIFMAMWPRPSPLLFDNYKENALRIACIITIPLNAYIRHLDFYKIFEHKNFK